MKPPEIPSLELLEFWIPPNETIDYWLQRSKYSVNSCTYGSPSLRHLILDARGNIERWDLITSYLLFPVIHERLVLTQLAPDLDVKNGLYSLWGASLKFSDYLPNFKAVALSHHYNHPDTIKEMRNIAVFNIPARCLATKKHQSFL